MRSVFCSGAASAAGELKAIELQCCFIMTFFGSMERGLVLVYFNHGDSLVVEHKELPPQAAYTVRVCLTL